MPFIFNLSMRRLRQQWQRVRLSRRNAGPPRIREFYTSDFIILEGAICKVFWKVENAWRLTLEPVPVPGGHAALDVTGRIYADVVADARYHTLYLHADGVSGQRVSQLLDLRPLPVHLKVPSPALLHRSRPSLPLEQLRPATHPGPALPAWTDRPPLATTWQPQLQPAGLRQQQAQPPAHLAPGPSRLPALLLPLRSWLDRLHQATTPAEVARLKREAPL